MKKTICLIITCLISNMIMASQSRDITRKLAFDNSKYVEQTILLPDGKSVAYQAYENIYYVAHVEDSVYQTLNIYVPKSAVGKHTVPLFLRTYVGGYMASKANTPSATDATGRALAEGYVVCIPGARGANSTVAKANGEVLYTGTAPNGLLDIKAAVRYLKLNDKVMAGDANKIIVDGTSAGGAMASLMGATGNHPLYNPYLEKMGAAKTSDDIFAVVAYCPIIDLEHADMAYEWLYRFTNRGVRGLSEEQCAISDELSAEYVHYLNSLSLRDQKGTQLTSENYREYLKSFFINSLQRAQDEGNDLPDTIGILRYEANNRATTGSESARIAPSFGPGGEVRRRVARKSEFIADLDLERYLTYVASGQALKTPPSFDSQGIVEAKSSPENRVFGEPNGESKNFTLYSLRKATNNLTAELDETLQKRIFLMNPMNFIADKQAQKAPHWYIRHGLRDRDTAFSVPVNFVTLLRNHGYEVNFALPWNRPHSGDYNLNDLFTWINQLTD